MASNNFDRLMDLNIRMVRDANRKNRQQETTRKTWAQTQRNADRAAAYKDRELERRRYEEARRAPILERYYNRGHLQGVASGRKDPRQAMLDMSPTPESLAMARPEAFANMNGTTATARGSRTTAGTGRTGIPGLDYGKMFDAAGKHMEALSDPMAQGELPTEDRAGRPLTPEQARAYVARQRLLNQTRMAGELLPQEQAPERPATMPEAYQNRLEAEAAEREHFDKNLVTSEETDKEGNKYKRFSLPAYNPAGSDFIRDINPENVKSIGFGRHRQDVSNRPPASVDTAIANVFGRPRQGKWDDKGIVSDSDPYAYEPAPANPPVRPGSSSDKKKNSKSKKDSGSSKSRKQQTEEKQKLSKRDEFLKRATTGPERKPKNLREAFYGVSKSDSEPVIPRAVAGAQSFFGQNFPKGDQRPGEDEIAFALRKAGLGGNLYERKKMSQNLQRQYPDASMEEIIEMIRKVASE
jgi:hypothetical protein